MVIKERKQSDLVTQLTQLPVTCSLVDLTGKLHVGNWQILCGCMVDFIWVTGGLYVGYSLILCDWWVIPV